MAWPPAGGVGPGDLATARFRVGLRGYRMDEVDRVLDDARAALADRDDRIAELERVVRVLAPGRGDPAQVAGAMAGTEATAGTGAMAGTQASGGADVQPAAEQP